MNKFDNRSGEYQSHYVEHSDDDDDNNDENNEDTDSDYDWQNSVATTDIDTTDGSDGEYDAEVCTCTI